MDEQTYRFATQSEVILYTRPMDAPSARWSDWQEFDRGPGIFQISASQFLGVHADAMTDETFKILVDELEPIAQLRYLHLPENRGISNRGMQHLARLTQLEYLNISSCDINNEGMAFVQSLTHLSWIDLSYCNRISDGSAKYFQKLTRLEYMNILGVPKINMAGLKKFERRGREIYRG